MGHIKLFENFDQEKQPLSDEEKKKIRSQIEDLTGDIMNAPTAAKPQMKKRLSALKAKLNEDDHMFADYPRDQAKKDLVKPREEKKIRWTDKEGHSYSVIAKDFITANALYLALGKSPLVRKAEFIPLD